MFAIKTTMSSTAQNSYLAGRTFGSWSDLGRFVLIVWVVEGIDCAVP